MPRTKEVDATEMISAVESGLPSQEIMTRFGIRTLAHLKAIYLDALVAQGRVKGIVGRRPKAAQSENKNKIIEVNNRGSLIVPEEVVQKYGFKIGDTLTVLKTGGGISLRKD